jgi:sulfur-oxidizing protein SoxY
MEPCFRIYTSAAAVRTARTSVKDIDQALIDLGKTRLKLSTDRTRGENWREVQAQIRHPNFSGMQIDAKTNAYTPAHFIENISFSVGSQNLATLETGIAISEDPNIRQFRHFVTRASDDGGE